jgi:hypothetical protein
LFIAQYSIEFINMGFLNAGSNRSQAVISGADRRPGSYL